MTLPAPSFPPVMLQAIHNPPAKTSYRCRVISDFAAFNALASEWDAFLERAGIHNLCMTHGFLQCWLSHFPPEQLLVLIVENADGQWVGTAPLKISRASKGVSHRLLWHLQWIGTDPTVYDWMQFAILPGIDERGVIQSMAQAIQHANWDVLDLEFGLERSQLEHLCNALGKPPNEAVLRQSDVMPFIALPAQQVDYEKMRRKKTRLEVNRHCNALTRDFGSAPELRILASSPETEPVFQDFINRHITYWASRGSKSDFVRYPKLSAFYKTLLSLETPPNRPKLHLSILAVGDEILSYHFDFWQGNSYLAHITTYNQDFKKYGPGTVHMDKLIFETLAQGGAEFSFGRGDEPYKKLWTQEKKALWGLRLFRNKIHQTLWELDPCLKRIARFFR